MHKAMRLEFTSHITMLCHSGKQ